MSLLREAGEQLERTERTEFSSSRSGKSIKTPQKQTHFHLFVMPAVLKDLLLLGAPGGGSRTVTYVVSNGPAQLVHPGPGLCDLLGCTDHI